MDPGRSTERGARVLYVSDVYFPRVNGVSTSIRTFRSELAALGCEVTLVAPAYGADDRPEAGLLRVPARRVPFDPEDRMLRGAELRHTLAGLVDREFDLVHIQTPFLAHRAGVRFAAKLGVPAIETYHTHFEQYFGHYVPFAPAAWLRALARGLARRQCRRLAGLVVPSEPMAATLRSYGIEGRMTVIPTGLPLRQFRTGDGARFRNEHGIAAGRPVLVHVGRVAFEKNIEFVLRAAARARREQPDLLLIIAGEGPALPSLRRLAHDLDMDRHTLFVGYLDRSTTLLDCYAAGDAFVFASRTETQGLVLLEAMALGVPVISTAVLGTRDLLSAGRGALVPTEDLDDFSGQIARLVRDPELRARLSAEGRALAQEWSAERQAARMLELYRETITRGRAPARGTNPQARFSAR